MAKETKYRCDRCGAEKLDDRDFLVPIAIIRDYQQHRSSFQPVVKQAEWCHACMVTMQVIGQKKDEAGPPVPEVTIEDLIREIVREEACE
jgi:hypothetical protein